MEGQEASCFFSTNCVEASSGYFAKRGDKGQQGRDTISAPMAQQDYVQFYAAVDKNDRDIADWSTTIRTNRYYIRIFCWALDRVIQCFVVVTFNVKQCIGKKEWRIYSE